jgi:hypothetical protein
VETTKRQKLEKKKKKKKKKKKNLDFSLSYQKMSPQPHATRFTFRYRSIGKTWCTSLNRAKTVQAKQNDANEKPNENIELAGGVLPSSLIVGKKNSSGGSMRSVEMQ